MIDNNFITINIFTTPFEDVVTVGFRLIVKHDNKLRKDFGVEKVHVFREVLGFNYMKNESDIIHFISRNTARLLKSLELVIESKIARVPNEEGYMINFPFTEWKVEKLCHV